MHKTNRIHLAVCARVYPDNTKGTSKRGKNISHATRRPSARNVLPCFTPGQERARSCMLGKTFASFIR